MAEGRQLILASGSSTRRAMLEAAGVCFSVKPADVDERALQDQWRAADVNKVPGELATTLAEAKALNVSLKNADTIVIGGDQVLALDGEIFGKARDREEARRTLKALRGHTHTLQSTAVLAVDGKVIWSELSIAYLSVRSFSDAWLESYLDSAGDVLTQSVGAYAFEDIGIQLFDKVDGDYFTILGLPLLPLLVELRRQGAIPV